MANSKTNPSWEFLGDWSVPPTERSWEHIRNWTQIFVSESSHEYENLDQSLQWWDLQFAEYGKDPLRRNWAEFRPLLDAREEDWSDWLAYLLSNSRLFGDYLFPMTGYETWAVRYVNREEIARGHDPSGTIRRGDIVIVSNDKLGLTMEIKINDPNYSKTPETVKKIEDEYDGDVVNWFHFILLRNEAVESCKSCVIPEEYIETAAKIRILTWEHVSAALRLTIIDARERDLIWKSLAYVFCGMIERQILAFPDLSQVREMGELDPIKLRQAKLAHHFVKAAQNAEFLIKDLQWIS